ncbi:MAG: hypothetical protein KKE86_00895 [Planctomycetes bacterium]|nr:hypothetical protein [Planctomycetota bacterium]MBU4397868.1 hypothetical protein [Planctomycetota bacterium]MCG2684093.1 hypothetical protein [Planctomycetales bacterium]
MSYRMTTGWVLAFVALFVVCAGCPRGPSRIHPPSINASAAGDKAIEMFDADKDGKLSGEELDKCPGVKAALAQIDPTGQGAVTADMITARIGAWQDSKLGRMSFSCRVTHNGRPLQGAEVKFVPEKFLGENVQVATGKTDQNGMAMINVPNLTPPGLAPGLYRVEITKPGLDIPAKYNTETILGQEAALDAKGIQEGVVFQLSF